MPGTAQSLISKIPDIITASAQRPLGIISLLVIVFASLSYLFFRRSHENWKLASLAMLLLGGLAFGYATLTGRESVDKEERADTGSGPRAAREERSAAADVLPPTSHFQVDNSAGVFCEERNVHRPLFQYFDIADINIRSCGEPESSASRSYRISWPQEGPRAVTPEDRRNYRHCFVSDLPDRGPKFVRALSASFDKLRDRVPCRVAISVTRVISGAYLDLQNVSREVAFVQQFNVGESGRLTIDQVGTGNLAKSSDLAAIELDSAYSVGEQQLVEIVKSFRFPGVPRPSN